MSEDEEQLSKAEVEAMVRQGALESIVMGDLEEGRKYITEDLTFYPTSGEELGEEELTAASAMFQEAFPDIEADIEEVIFDPDTNEVAFHYVTRGTHENQFQEIPPTGERFEAHGIAYAKLKGKKMDEYHLVFDRFGMMQDLGVMG